MAKKRRKTSRGIVGEQIIDNITDEINNKLVSRSNNVSYYDDRLQNSRYKRQSIEYTTFNQQRELRNRQRMRNQQKPVTRHAVKKILMYINRPVNKVNPMEILTKIKCMKSRSTRRHMAIRNLARGKGNGTQQRKYKRCK